MSNARIKVFSHAEIKKTHLLFGVHIMQPAHIHFTEGVFNFSQCNRKAHLHV